MDTADQVHALTELYFLFLQGEATKDGSLASAQADGGRPWDTETLPQLCIQRLDLKRILEQILLPLREHHMCPDTKGEETNSLLF